MNLQTAAQQYMMELDVQHKTTPIPFQKTQSPPRQVSMNEHYIPVGQNTWLSQIVQKQPAQLPDGTPGIGLQIPYLEEFFGTMWYLIHEDTFELYAIYDAIFTEITYFAQLQTFDLVPLDTNLQEHLDSRMNHIRMHMEWIAQVGDSFIKWFDSAPTGQPLPCSMLTLEQRQKIHNDFVKVTDFLGTTYRAYKELINADPTNRLEHMTNWDKALGKVRKCFKCIETCVVSDNYFRLISSLPLAPYLECQPSQAALEQNSSEYLTALAQLEVNSVNRLLEQPEMYQEGNTTSNTLTLPAPQGTTTPVTTASGFHPIGGTPPVTQATQLTQLSHTQALKLLESQAMTGSIVQKPTPVHLTDQHMAQPGSSTSLTQEQPVTPVSVSTTLHRSGWIQLSLHLLVRYHPRFHLYRCPYHKSQV